MENRWKVFISLLLSAFMVFSSASADKSDPPPAPTLMGNVLVDDPTEKEPGPGTWYLGADPEGAEKTKAPIVFIHGIHGYPHDWWGKTRYYGENDAYKLAHSQGYRTAFVQLYDGDRGAANQWVNGKILTQLLAKIYKHYGQKVNLVAHSKGGIDTQTALVHYDAYRYVNKVITIATPHSGCYLADLAYSWYAGWLAELLHLQDEGTYALQMANMAEFRAQTDKSPNVKKTDYFTVSGTSWGPFPSGLWLGGAYLWQYGDNDGMITEESTHLPYAKHIATLAEADHDSIRKGSFVFPIIEPILAANDSELNAVPKKQIIDGNTDQSEQFISGGELQAKKQVVEKVAMDASTKEVVFNVMTKSPEATVSLISPSGKKYSKTNREYFATKAGNIFNGASMQTYRIRYPEKGTWKVQIKSKEQDAYFLTTIFRGSSTYSMKLPLQSMKTEVPLEVKLANPSNFDPKTMNITMKVVEPKHANIQARSFEATLKPSSIRGFYVGQLAGVTHSGLYNVTIEIKGKTKDGLDYQRTIIQSIRVGNSAPTM